MPPGPMYGFPSPPRVPPAPGPPPHPGILYSGPLSLPAFPRDFNIDFTGTVVPINANATAVDDEGTSTPLSEDTFSVIEGEGETGSGFQELAEEKAKIVQELWESTDKKCACCIPWVNERPQDVEPEPEEPETEDEMPIVVRRRRTNGGRRAFEIHSTEIRSAALRAVLFRVFDRFDNLIPFVRYLTFMAPFKVFYWRWDEFERAIREERDEDVARQLKYLRKLVKTEIHHTFTVTRELLQHGVITHAYLWTLFQPGELVYCNDEGQERLYVLRCTVNNGGSISLYLKYVDWDGTRFGMNEDSVEIGFFPGSKKITEMMVFPAKYLGEERLAQVKERMMARGRKFVDLAGIHHKSYREKETEGDRRIIIDAAAHTDDPYLSGLPKVSQLQLYSGLITQTPVAPEVPEGGHVPLDDKQPRPVKGISPPPPPPACFDFGPPPPMPVQARTRPTQITTSKNSKFSTDNEKVKVEERDDDPKRHLTDYHLLIASPLVRGFCLKDKCWRRFDVDHVHDIAWNKAVFDQLVLPEGYKDLILAHCEAQLREGCDSIDDVINGKGGGLVILLAGEPGVGKTMTVESVAEYIQAPLYKMELRVSGQKPAKKKHVRPPKRRMERHGIVYDSDCEEPDERDEITEDFELAARWQAVLLIDEADTYLQKRSDVDARRNRVVAAFLQKLEYYPSLLFLTTNREATLDIALQSRVHLTINYPALDYPSRLLIWQNFLARCQPEADVGEEDLVRLASIEAMNGRRIKNVVKTAQIMARKLGRGVRVEDVERVLRITEGLVLVT